MRSTLTTVSIPVSTSSGQTFRSARKLGNSEREQYMKAFMTLGRLALVRQVIEEERGDQFSSSKIIANSPAMLTARAFLLDDIAAKDLLGLITGFYAREHLNIPKVVRDLTEGGHEAEYDIGVGDSDDDLAGTDDGSSNSIAGGDDDDGREQPRRVTRKGKARATKLPISRMNLDGSGEGNITDISIGEGHGVFGLDGTGRGSSRAGRRRGAIRQGEGSGTAKKVRGSPEEAIAGPAEPRTRAALLQMSRRNDRIAKKIRSRLSVPRSLPSRRAKSPGLPAELPDSEDSETDDEAGHDDMDFDVRESSEVAEETAPGDSNEKEEEEQVDWEVQSIIDSGIVFGRLEYQIRWESFIKSRGYPDSWEPAALIQVSSLLRFHICKRPTAPVFLFAEEFS